MFEAYRGAICATVSGCVPGWAYKEGAACMELPEPDLTASALLQVQQQFYRETGTEPWIAGSMSEVVNFVSWQMAVFMGCESGEIERDKAAVLANTTEYMDKLISQVSELEEKNRQLEAQLAMHAIAGEPQQTAAFGGGSGEESSERVRVDVAIVGSSASASHRSREVSIRVAVRAECDVSKLVVAVLSRLRGMGRFGVVSVDARQRDSSLAQASLTLRVTEGMRKINLLDLA
uniref:BHLH domain-containing protein n=1 Tax=Oryza brachyantha TaxID=4533 RepID=J3MF64_ORYBR